MQGRWESNINVLFPFMYSQKWNCGASLFPKQNYNSYTHISVEIIYFQDQSANSAAGKYVDWSWEYINRSQTHELEFGTEAVPFPEKEYINGILQCSNGAVVLCVHCNLNVSLHKATLNKGSSQKTSPVRLFDSLWLAWTLSSLHCFLIGWQLLSLLPNWLGRTRCKGDIAF